MYCDVYQVTSGYVIDDQITVQKSEIYLLSAEADFFPLSKVFVHFVHDAAGESACWSLLNDLQQTRLKKPSKRTGMDVDHKLSI